MIMLLHKSVTRARITEAVERGNNSLDNPGICVACGADADGCEPDAREYTCECCGARKVFGAEELMMRYC